jgi:hypothetical protein
MCIQENHTLKANQYLTRFLQNKKVLLLKVLTRNSTCHFLLLFDIPLREESVYLVETAATFAISGSPIIS